MTRPLALAASAALVALAACGADPLRYAAPRVEPTARISVPYAGIEVRDVSLPTYAALEEVTIVAVDGAITSDGDTLWADDPVRAVTLDLARALSRITGARVAPEPWPFRSLPDATVDVRVSDLITGAAIGPTGVLRLSGQYFVAPEIEGRREIARLFDLTVPYDADGGLPALARARAEAVARLAELIAGEGMG